MNRSTIASALLVGAASFASVRASAADDAPSAAGPAAPAGCADQRSATAWAGLPCQRAPAGTRSPFIRKLSGARWASSPRDVS